MQPPSSPTNPISENAIPDFIIASPPEALDGFILLLK
jgi:hypothetical protein